MSKRYIILMADMISSQKMPQPVTQNEFKHIVSEINSKYRKNILSPLTITLGDEFQSVIKDVNTAIKIIIEIEEYLVFRNSSIFLRYVVHEGEIDTEINTENAHGMVGNGLTQTRKLLSYSKKTKERFLIAIDDNDTIYKKYRALFNLYNMFIELWGRKEGELIEWFLNLDDYKLVAEKVNKNRSLIWKRKKSLQIEPYKSLKKLFEYAYTS